MNWESIKDTVGKAAPILGTLVAGPAGASVGALIANALGTDPTPASVNQALLDPDKQADLQRWAYEHEEKLSSIALGTLEAELSDKQSARKENKHSNMPSVIVIILTLLITGIAMMLFNVAMPERNEDIVFYLVGQISALWGASVTYWVGTTRSSAEKNKWRSKLSM